MPSTLSLMPAVERFSVLCCVVIIIIIAVPGSAAHLGESNHPSNSSPILNASTLFAEQTMSPTIQHRSRRSLNVYGLPKQQKAHHKYARIYSINGLSFLQADPSGTPSTTRLTNSANAIVEILFVCQLAQAIFSNGCHDDRSFVASDEEPVTLSGDGYRSNDRASHVILMRFRATKQFLCMDSKARLYLTDDVESYSDCSFWHVHLLNQYDAYYSFSHPHYSDQCQLRNPRKSSRATVPHGRPTSKTRCRRNWYLGVTKKGQLRTFQISSHDGEKLKRAILFIQRWTGLSANDSFPIIPSTATTPMDSQGVSSTAKDRVKRRNCSVLLRRCSRKAKRRLRRFKAPGVAD